MILGKVRIPIRSSPRALPVRHRYSRGMKRLALLTFVSSLVFASGALASQAQHTVTVPVTQSSAFSFALPDSVSARKVPHTPSTHGELTENTPQCRGGVIDSSCPAGSYDAVALAGSSPTAALRSFDQRDQLHPLAHGTTPHHLIWDRFSGGSLVLVAPVTCASLGAHPPRVCGQSARGTKYVALLLTGSTPPSVLTRVVDATVTASARFVSN